MYHNSRPPIIASALPAGHLDMRPGQVPMVVCGHCGQWTVLTRSIARWHKLRGTQDDCPGGGQRYRLDVDATQVEIAPRTGIRAHRSFREPQPPTPESVVHIARARRQAGEAHAALDRLERALA